MESSHRNNGITQESVRRFLRQRAINWKQDQNTPTGALITNGENIVGCLCVSAGVKSTTETILDGHNSSSNKAWIIPTVQSAVFRFLDFCVDVDTGYGDVGMYCSDRWASMEIEHPL